MRINGEGLVGRKVVKGGFEPVVLEWHQLSTRGAEEMVVMVVTVGTDSFPAGTALTEINALD